RLDGIAAQAGRDAFREGLVEHCGGPPELRSPSARAVPATLAPASHAPEGRPQGSAAASAGRTKNPHALDARPVPPSIGLDRSGPIPQTAPPLGSGARADS